MMEDGGKMKRLYFIFGMVLGLLFSFDLAAFGKSVAVHGLPIIQTRSSKDVTTNIKLDSRQQISNRLLINKEDGKYYWQTRDNRELVYQKFKGYDLYIDMKTGGYIKVVKQPDGRYVYTEHISLKRLRSFTYWGVTLVYDP